MKKAYKIPLIVLGVVFGLLLVANFVAGPVAKSYVEKHDKELLGRELNIKRVGVNLFTGKLKINELTLFEDDATTPFVQFERFETKLRLRDLLQHRLWVKKALLSGLKVNVEQNRDWFNFNSLRDHLASRKTKESSADFGLVLNDVTIEKGCFRYADLAMGNEFNLNDIALNIPSLDLSDLNTDVGLDLCLSDHATLHTDIRLSDNAKKYCINLKLSNLDIEVIEPYVQQQYPIDFVGGAINLDVEAQGSSDHILDFDMKGDLVFNNIALRDTEGKPLANIDSVFAKVNHINLKDKEMDFKQVHISGLKLDYVIDADSLTNFDLVLENYHRSDSLKMLLDSDTLSLGLKEKKPWNVSIEDLALEGAQLFFEDHTLPETFHYEMSDINLISKHFTLDGNNAIQMQAALNTVGKLHLKWQGNFRGRDNHNLTLMLSNVKIADFSPYVVQWFGVPVENGTLSFHSQNVILDGNLNGINKLQVFKPEFGNKLKHFRPRFEKVPLRLGIYLLSDKHNNVSLDLPVSGDLNDPHFSYRKALAKVFSNVLTKVAASPFRLMTDEDNNLKYIPFDPLQFDFTPEQYVMIDNVVATLQSRSDLSIILEEQVQYEEAIKELCIMQLKHDFYFSEHSEMKPSDMDFLTNEAIRSIKLTDKGLCEFAAQYSSKRRLHSSKDVSSVAWERYHDKSEKMLPRLMAKRNEMLTDYLWKAKGLSPEQITVTTMDESLLKSFVKPSRYEMHVFRYEDME